MFLSSISSSDSQKTLFLSSISSRLMTLKLTLEDSEMGSGMDSLGKHCFHRVFDTPLRTLKLTLGWIVIKRFVFFLNISSPVEDSEIDSEVVPTGKHYFVE